MTFEKIFIYGVPGTGKTHYAQQLGKELHIPIIEGDLLRKKYRENKLKKEHPFLFLGTCKAYRQFGDLTSENVIKGLLAVREVLEPVIDNAAIEDNNFILEAAFLNPSKLISLGRVILLTTLDRNIHKKHFLHHLEKRFDIEEKEFKAARIAQEYLIHEAKSLKLEIIDNSD